MSKFSFFKKNLLIVLALLATITVGGGFINYLINKLQPQVNNTPSHYSVIDQYFNNALAFMQNNQYQQAVHQWHQLLVLVPQMPEAHVNLGFSLYELKKYPAASEYFQRAMDINPYQLNAYYGLAMCYEKLGDIYAATGAMRSYIHLAKKDDPFVRKAKSALWEWESQLNQDATQDPQLR
jgi:tetratricopeptide (TPR) repeat protein